ncbi:ABC transporter substrate-binding protein [Aquihabitans sp. G128]|uniref:ABC transporter substrate-binding protein n=1 Tax=Aquihabitans sp. G128 TaxID=2849779 RepID=UPI001C22E562|nr:ABC transporter substrate-binding protein [Aquihabitans sp. G128]QXC61389.1 ABC transporter substrate-binding protein [Aquihabitans sp. G128]
MALSISIAGAACTRSDGEVETGAPSTTAAGGTATTAAGGGGDLGPGDFGSLKEVCGPGDAKGATDQGVTDDSIEVGTISDAGFVGRPGLNQEMFDAAKVFSEWCNAAGGINGREIKVDELDAKLTEYKQRITEGCQKDFFLVGGGGVFDNTGQDERLKCLLPEVPAYQVTPEARGAELAVAPLPSALDEVPVGVYQYLGKKFPDATDHVGFLTGNVPATVVTDKQNQEGVKSLGWKVAYQAQYNSLGESSWTPFAQAFKSKKLKGVVYTGEPENAAKLLQAIDDIGYKLDFFVVGANHLDQNFIDVGGSAIHDVYMASAVVPPFEQDQNPATKQYHDLFAKYAPKGKVDALLGVNSFSAFLLFATAAKECGSDVTRKCVYDNLAKVKEWDGGGLHAVTDPSSGKASRCLIVVEGTPDGFEVPKDYELTDGLFRCDDSSVVGLKGDYGKGAKLSDVGKSLDDLD